jgi:hypothetical protein
MTVSPEKRPNKKPKKEKAKTQSKKEQGSQTEIKVKEEKEGKANDQRAPKRPQREQQPTARQTTNPPVSCLSRR